MRAFKLLIAIVLLPAHTQAAEGCKEKLSWKCGDVCIHRRAKCSCDGTTFSDDDESGVASRHYVAEEENGTRLGNIGEAKKKAKMG